MGWVGDTLGTVESGYFCTCVVETEGEDTLATTELHHLTLATMESCHLCTFVWEMGWGLEIH